MNNSNSSYMNMPELLSPVGGWAHLNSAVNNGADAVYMGGTLFNARIYAENFTQDDLPKAIDFAHSHNVKVYITLNTLIKDEELCKALEYAAWLYEIGADAIILQDLGLARLIHRYIPDFPMHLSTQGTVYNPQALDTVRELGFVRIVPARELELTEIEAMCGNGLEIETFVHGALCMCYSGQCQLSRGLSGGEGSRSGNRGTCAQPCRHPYTDDSGRRYYALSPKDLCLLEHLPELIAAGISSFKIEGRIKSPEYVAVVTRIYRRYIDLYADLLKAQGGSHEAARAAYRVRPQDMESLRQSFNRGGFTEGYLFGNPGDDILSGTSPKNQGIGIGRVVAIIDSEAKVDNIDDRRAVRGALKRGRVLVCLALNGELEMNDGIEFRGDTPEFEGNPVGNVVTYVRNMGDGLYIAGDFERGRRSINIGDSVYRVTSRKLNEAALDADEKKLPVTFSFTARTGQYLSLVMTDVKSGYSHELISDHIVEAAIKAPTDEGRIISQLCRLGDTPYKADANSCDIQLDEGAMVPVSLINRMRRECADVLLDERVNGIRKRRSPLSRARLDVIAASEQLGTDRLDFEATREACESKAGPLGGRKIVPLEVFMEKIAGAQAKETSASQDSKALAGSVRKICEAYIPYILNVSKGNLDRYIEDNWEDIIEAVRYSGILIGNLGWIGRFREAGAVIYADYGLNVFNRQAAKLCSELGLAGYAVSCEAGIADSRGLPLMITEHPVHSAYLLDRKGKKHTVRRSASGDKYLIF